MGETASPYCLYDEGDIIDDALTSTIETITAANIVGFMIKSGENWTSVANYVERILRLKERVLENVEHAGLENTCTCVTRSTKQGPGRKEYSGETWMSPQVSIHNSDADMITRGQRAIKDCTPK